MILLLQWTVFYNDINHLRMRWCLCSMIIQRPESFSFSARLGFNVLFDQEWVEEQHFVNHSFFDSLHEWTFLGLL